MDFNAAGLKVPPITPRVIRSGDMSVASVSTCHKGTVGRYQEFPQTHGHTRSIVIKRPTCFTMSLKTTGRVESMTSRVCIPITHTHKAYSFTTILVGCNQSCTSRPLVPCVLHFDSVVSVVS